VRWVETSVGIVGEVYRLLDRMLDIASLRTLETVPAGAALRTTSHAQSPLPGPQRAALEQARLLLLQRSSDGTDRALALAEEVAGTHSAAAEAWATLAATLYSRMSFMDHDHATLLVRLRRTVDRALALDADQPIALRTKAIIAGKCDYDADAAESLFLRALRSMPHYTSARTNYAEILTLAGRFDEAVAQLNLARLHDPLSASVHLARAICLGYQRRYVEAREAWKLCRAAGESSLWIMTGEGMNELASGNVDAAAAMLEANAQLALDQPALLICQACMHAAMGDDSRSRMLERTCLERFPTYSPAHRAVLAALREDRDSMLGLIDVALRTTDMALLPATMDPALDRYADDPALRALRERCPIWARRPSFHAPDDDA
jgi:tetratricopeptide (TPR) repeat protein